MYNPYRKLVAGYASMLKGGSAFPLGTVSTSKRPTVRKNAPRAMLFSPHPDDECAVGGLALRLLREQRMNVINVAVTLGSRVDRRAARLAELTSACRYLGFDLALAAEGGLERINTQCREQEPETWRAAVDAVARAIEATMPQFVFMPHANDWNTTHIGTHCLVVDALEELGGAFSTVVIETEFWLPMPNPNLMVELSVGETADLVAALSLHVGEMRRNPFHLRLPAWMADSVRRGTEMVGGQGTAAPDFAFAALYGLRKWAGGGLHNILETGLRLSCSDDLGEILRHAQADTCGVK